MNWAAYAGSKKGYPGVQGDKSSLPILGCTGGVKPGASKRAGHVLWQPWDAPEASPQAQALATFAGDTPDSSVPRAPISTVGVRGRDPCKEDTNRRWLWLNSLGRKSSRGTTGREGAFPAACACFGVRPSGDRAMLLRLAKLRRGTGCCAGWRVTGVRLPALRGVRGVGGVTDRQRLADLCRAQEAPASELSTKEVFVDLP
mmetsp:Transcript_54331/g.119144  ORF Transcript_54331/g.119144 Transcript_54331/m.119144 type:complete len:201 (+) Transcript_54331:537-1139(+)